MEKITTNGVTVVTGATKAESGFDWQKSSSYFCANGLAVTISAREDGEAGFTASWTFEGEAYSMNFGSEYTVCGGSWDGEVASSSITMTGGTVSYGVFGGGVTADSKVSGDVSIEVLGGTLGDGVVGGGVCGAVDGNVAITLGNDKNGPAIQANVIGGGFMETAVVGGNVSVTINNVTMPANSICVGGGVFGDVTGAVSIVVAGGELGYLAGGSMGSGSVKNTSTKKYGAVFIIGIGGKLSHGEPHDNRAPDYDDWSTPNSDGYNGLNGDIIVWNELLGRSFELSSMGIRVNKEVMQEQLRLTSKEDRSKLYFHQRILSDSLPLCIGGGIGQSRLCMLFLKKAHIGEIQASIWSEEMKAECREAGIPLI